MNIEQQRAAFQAWLDDPECPLDANEFNGADFDIAYCSWKAAIELDRQGRGEPVAQVRWRNGDVIVHWKLPRGSAPLDAGTLLYLAPQFAVPVKVGSVQLIEAVTKAILFEDCGNTEEWRDSTNLGEAAIQAYREHAEQVAAQTAATRDVLAERHRQIEDEGWTPEHDDETHDIGALAAAGCAYALYAADELNPHSQGDGDYGRNIPAMWPFCMSWWKPDGTRRSLVKAGALVLAEIGRLDRVALQQERQP